MTLINLFAGIFLQAAPDAGPMSMISTFIPFILIIVVFYFLILRPQQKRQKQRKELLSSVKVGDEVITSGGIFGKVDHIEDNILYVKIADNVKIRIQKDAVGNIVGLTDKLPAKK
ncbi:MAG TPA: preprotein translocase subunit YajC [Ignavibacteria bacterium]